VQLARREHRTERHAAAQALGEGHDVGGDPELLRREPGTGPAEAGLDLVEDEERADARRQRPKTLQEGRRRGDDTESFLLFRRPNSSRAR